MKLEAEHKVLMVRALGMLAGVSAPDMTRQIEKLIEQIATKDVHIVPENHIEKLIALYAELQALNEQARKTMHTYIETVQKRCQHRFHKPNPNGSYRPIKTDSCQICGYVIGQPADKLRLMED
jgi:hypothetical protein